MILTLTPNPALDVTYQIDELRPGHTHRVAVVSERAGGKGFNVSRVLHEMGVPTLAVAPAGGVLGDSIRADLEAAGVPHALLPVSAPTRMTIAVVPSRGTGDATLFNEAGHALPDEDWDRLLAVVAQRLEEAHVLVCSGSMPPAAPDDLCARVVELARRRHVPVVLDTSGPALVAAAKAGADVLKPNTVELLEALDISDPVAGARALCGYGAGAVVLSRGAEGMVAVTPEGEWRAVPPFVVRGNPTGAGDAAVAALAAGVGEQQAWPIRLRTAVAWSAAAVASPLAGSVDAATLREIYDDVVVEGL